MKLRLHVWFLSFFLRVDSFLPATTTTRVGSCSSFSIISFFPPRSMAKIQDADMSGRFERWRLLQNILDEEIEEDQVEALVDMVVSAVSHEAGPVTKHPKNVQALERLYLPDPEQNKDAFASLWDTIAELHGREGVKIDLRDNPQWPYLCCLCRILLHYDFLTKGIVEKTVAVVDDAPSEGGVPYHDA